MNITARRISTGLLAALLVVSSGIAVSPKTSAAQANDSDLIESILITPVSKRYELKTGTTKTDSVKVFNDGKQDYNFIVYARPYSVSNEAYEPDFVSRPQNADAYKWVQFEKASYFIKAGKSTDVNYTIRVPEGATPGGHYGVLFAETQPSESVSGNAVKRKKRVGAITYVNVEGDIRRSGSVKDMSVPPFQFTPPLKVGQRINNSGNTDFTVDSQVKVFDIFGQQKYNATKQHVVLPGTTRDIRMDWSSPSWIALYRVESSVKFLDTDRMTTSYVLLVPAWVYATLAVLIAGRILYAMANRKKS